jgi:diadenosine tetraphosphate (Ap4A) HIT family hydrolase
LTRSPLDCCFCAELAGRDTEFHELYPDLDSRIVLETRSFVAMPSMGQLAPGHLLLMPRTHVASFGQLGPTLRAEAETVYRRLRAVLASRFSAPVSFEHGSPPGSTNGGCGIVHAHIHLVPVGGFRDRRPADTGTGWRASTDAEWLNNAAVLSRRGSGYLMWHGSRAGAVYLDEVTAVPSQHLRQHVAKVLGRSEWDWRNFGAQRSLPALVKDLASVAQDAGA